MYESSPFLAVTRKTIKGINKYTPAVINAKSELRLRRIFDCYVTLTK